MTKCRQGSHFWVIGCFYTAWGIARTAKDASTAASRTPLALSQRVRLLKVAHGRQYTAECCRTQPRWCVHNLPQDLSGLGCVCAVARASWSCISFWLHSWRAYTHIM